MVRLCSWRVVHAPEVIRARCSTVLIAGAVFIPPSTVVLARQTCPCCPHNFCAAVVFFESLRVVCSVVWFLCVGRQCCTSPSAFLASCPGSGCVYCLWRTNRIVVLVLEVVSSPPRKCCSIPKKVVCSPHIVVFSSLLGLFDGTTGVFYIPTECYQYFRGLLQFPFFFMCWRLIFQSGADLYFFLCLAHVCVQWTFKTAYTR